MNKLSAMLSPWRDFVDANPRAALSLIGIHGSVKGLRPVGLPPVDLKDAAGREVAVGLRVRLDGPGEARARADKLVAQARADGLAVTPEGDGIFTAPINFGRELDGLVSVLVGPPSAWKKVKAKPSRQKAGAASRRNPKSYDELRAEYDKHRDAAKKARDERSKVVNRPWPKRRTKAIEAKFDAETAKLIAPIEKRIEKHDAEAERVLGEMNAALSSFSSSYDDGLSDEDWLRSNPHLLLGNPGLGDRGAARQADADPENRAALVARIVHAMRDGSITERRVRAAARWGAVEAAQALGQALPSRVVMGDDGRRDMRMAALSALPPKEQARLCLDVIKGFYAAYVKHEEAPLPASADADRAIIQLAEAVRAWPDVDRGLGQRIPSGIGESVMVMLIELSEGFWDDTYELESFRDLADNWQNENLVADRYYLYLVLEACSAMAEALVESVTMGPGETTAAFNAALEFLEPFGYAEPENVGFPIGWNLLSYADIIVTHLLGFEVDVNVSHLLAGHDRRNPGPGDRSAARRAAADPEDVFARQRAASEANRSGRPYDFDLGGLTVAEVLVLEATAAYKSSYAGIKNYRFVEMNDILSGHGGLSPGVEPMTLTQYEQAQASLRARKLLNKANAITKAGRAALADVAERVFGITSPGYPLIRMAKARMLEGWGRRNPGPDDELRLRERRAAADPEDALAQRARDARRAQRGPLVYAGVPPGEIKRRSIDYLLDSATTALTIQHNDLMFFSLMTPGLGDVYRTLHKGLAELKQQVEAIKTPEDADAAAELAVKVSTQAVYLYQELYLFMEQNDRAGGGQENHGSWLALNTVEQVQYARDQLHELELKLAALAWSEREAREGRQRGSPPWEPNPPFWPGRRNPGPGDRGDARRAMADPEDRESLFRSAAAGFRVGDYSGLMRVINTMDLPSLKLAMLTLMKEAGAEYRELGGDEIIAIMNALVPIAQSGWTSGFMATSREYADAALAAWRVGAVKFGVGPSPFLEKAAKLGSMAARVVGLVMGTAYHGYALEDEATREDFYSILAGLRHLSGDPAKEAAHQLKVLQHASGRRNPDPRSRDAARRAAADPEDRAARSRALLELQRTGRGLERWRIDLAASLGDQEALGMTSGVEDAREMSFEDQIHAVPPRSAISLSLAILVDFGKNVAKVDTSTAEELRRRFDAASDEELSSREWEGMVSLLSETAHAEAFEALGRFDVNLDEDDLDGMNWMDILTTEQDLYEVDPDGENGDPRWLLVFAYYGAASDLFLETPLDRHDDSVAWRLDFVMSLLYVAWPGWMERANAIMIDEAMGRNSLARSNPHLLLGNPSSSSPKRTKRKNPLRKPRGAIGLEKLPKGIRDDPSFEAARAAMKRRYGAEPDHAVPVKAPPGSAPVLAAIGDLKSLSYIAADAPGEPVDHWIHEAGDNGDGERKTRAPLVAYDAINKDVLLVDPPGAKQVFTSRGIKG